MAERQVVIYTDGACDPNPGPGGWAAILRYGSHEKVISGGDPETTNNRMELQAALSALKTLTRSCRLTMYTDSEYLRRGITQWLAAWIRAGWRTSDRRAVRNQDLWQALAAEVQRHHVDWRWVRGHAGDPLNERVDRLARGAIPRPDSHAADGSVVPTRDASTLQLFTRASCLGNSGPGGWAVVLRQGDEVKSRSGSVTTATANEMELRAAIRGLRSLTGPSQVQLLTVSQYLHQGITQWVAGWQARGWKTKEGQPVRHKALWLALQEAMDGHQIEWHILRAGHRPQESEQAAVLASQAAHTAKEQKLEDAE
jgi:ribonuclease HI